MAEEFTIVTVAADPERFEELAADHARWRQVASNLVAAAELLWPHIEESFRAALAGQGDGRPGGLRYRAPFYLLMGLAVENLAKAIIVRQKQLRSEGMTKGDVLAFGGTHDLAAFVRMAGVGLNEGELSLLARLSGFVQWQGRYPVPKRRADTQQSNITGSTDMREIKALLGRLETEYVRLQSEHA